MQIGSNKWDAVGRSFRATRNRSGPGMDPWETQQVIYLRFVLLTWMYCFLSVK